MITKSRIFAEKFNLINKTSHFSLEFNNSNDFQNVISLLDAEGYTYRKKVLQPNQLFDKLIDKVKSIKGDDDFFSELVKVYLNTREIYTHYQNEIKCYHASLFKYIYVTLLSLEAYNYLIENKLIDSLDVLIFTTQSPELLQGEEKNHRNNPFFKSSLALKDYYNYFLELTENDNIHVSRYFLISEDDSEVMITRNKMKTQFCKKKSSGNCNECSDKCGGHIKRNDFLNINGIKENTFDISIITQLGESPEFRDFIAFNINGKYWDLAFATNLLNSSTSLFLKKWNRKVLENNNPFPFLGNYKEDNFKNFINYVKNNCSLGTLNSFWGMNTEKKKTVTVKK